MTLSPVAGLYLSSSIDPSLFFFVIMTIFAPEASIISSSIISLPSLSFFFVILLVILLPN
jgi:hypothetical protein